MADAGCTSSTKRRSKSVLASSAAAFLGLAVAASSLCAWWRPEVALILAAGDAASAEAQDMAKEALRNADAVCFDVDSTVVKTEGIDLLAACFGVYEEVANLTKTAMEGNVKFQDAMAQRLQIMQPTVEGVEKCLEKEKPRFTRGMKQVMARLQERGVDLYLVSGGFTLMIEPIAEILKIPKENIYANTILFDKSGNYKDFDRSAPTLKSGGKPAVVAKLKKTKGYKTVVMIGDGATDMDARPPATAFIGYGGVQVRPKVKAGADWFVTDWKQLMRELK